MKRVGDILGALVVALAIVTYVIDGVADLVLHPTIAAIWAAMLAMFGGLALFGWVQNGWRRHIRAQSPR